jgi:hypothetical protein
MKKLLALILCVMMFVSILPTSAFAVWPYVDTPLDSVSQYNKEINNMIKNTRKNVEAAYKVLVADQAVYGSAKAMDDAIVGLVDGIGKTLIEKGKMSKTYVDLVKDAVRGYVDGEVAKKISKNYYKALDSDGKRDPILYANLISKSISDVLTDKAFIKGYEAVVTYFALSQIAEDMRKEINDKYDDFKDNVVDSKFESDFAKKYTVLVDDYIDTFLTGDLKALNNKLVSFDHQDDLDLAYAAYAAAAAGPNATYKNAVDAAKADKAAAQAAAQAAFEAVMDSDTASATQKLNAYAARDYALSKADAEYERACIEAEVELNVALEPIAKEYNQDVKEINKEYNPLYETINPWAEVVLPTVGSWN